MEHGYLDGRIILHGSYYEYARFDAANECMAVQFDGSGGLYHYIRAKDGSDYASGHIRAVFSVGDEKINAFAKKSVEMIGRTVKSVIEDGDTVIGIYQFLAPSVNGVFTELTVSSKVKSDFTVGLYYGDNAPLFRFKSDGQTVKAENIQENHSFYIRGKLNKKGVIKTFYAFGASEAEADKAIADFDVYKKQAEEEIARLQYPKSASTEEEKAFYASAYFCAFENYRKHGEFAAFSAGCRYINPLRTYYRDGYWTVLAMYRDRPELVRQQIKTLARGIAADGSCPSAVLYDFNAFWGNHYDSPSFFIMMLYDYVNRTGDFSVLGEQCGNESILGTAVRVMDKLSECADETGLIYKEGPLNKRDWADEVNRNGYVAYDEILYVRALFCLSELLSASGDTVRAEKYLTFEKKAHESLDALLWDEQKGYYVNYKCGDFTEDNFSVDVLTAVIFGVCSKAQAERMLDAAETILDTRKNTVSHAGDFGIMCVYPLYKDIFATYKKSAQPFEYHNGANWPYLSAVCAYAEALHGRDYKYALTSWFDYNVKRGNYTPVEYFSPYCEDGSLLQAWSSLGAFVLDNVGKPSFFAPHLCKRNCSR